MPDSLQAVRAIRFDANAKPDAAAPTATAQWYADPTGRFKSGFWAGEPGRATVHYLKDELCILLEGMVRLTDEAGHVETYRTGDTFLIPNGFKGIWETVEPTRKFYAVHTPAED